ncbi:MULTISPECIES: carbohydrate ABC transporter permease [Streptomyces]|jgi:multiple sugar transport system permease protein|uniref:Multiple sugar transport system permease protein n=2 Tax=Streptomyces TaxID=1883 RepID=A0ABT9L7K3_STRGD|nr:MULTISPECIES: carbohydrate ABC transporter permease [Streptomyces]MDP9679695.1 multiple sugar transport system permease protein [Streptomyces griseoviridis]GGS99361.1 transporter [Streptomyces griseoviridis]GGU23404.1 transporter [Streptomyces daghestanicus]GHI29968.1 transporter [Streptomyces daghestanicus]
MKLSKRWLPAHVLVWSYAVLLIVPLYYFLASAFKTNDEIFAHPFALPTSFGFGNFRTAFDSADLGLAVVNSALVTVLALVVTLALALPAAFALARSTGRLASLVEQVFSLGFLIPTFAALFPTFLLAAATGLFHTRTFMVLFLPATAMPLSVVILVQFMRTIPREMEEAARMDGASTYAVLRHVYVPMCVPGIATVLLLNFLTFWNEYLYSLVIIGPDPAQRTVQVALPTLRSITGTDYGVLTAGTILTLVPVWIVYTVLQRRMQQALVSGAVKM